MILSFLQFAFLVSANIPALDTLQKTFKSVKSFEVSFTQELKQSLFPDDPDRASGRLMFTRPHSMSWTYVKPKPREILFDGSELKITEGKEVTIIRDSGRVTLEKSFSFLWGSPDLSLFKIQSNSKSSFIVMPQRAIEVNFDRIEVKLDGKLVSSVRVIDKLGSESLLSFSNWKFH